MHLHAKIWQHFANGISQNLHNLSSSLKNSDLENLKPTQLSGIINGIQASTFSLFTSLNEERLFSDEEVKTKQLQQEAEFKEFLQKNSFNKSN